MKMSMAFVATTISTRFRVPLPQTQRRFCSSPPSPSASKLFVGGHSLLPCCYSFAQPSFLFTEVFSGLSWSVDEKSLKDTFSSFGDVTEVRIVYDKDSGRSRGFGFVKFSNEDDAKCAKDAMDGKALLGRPLRINFALEKARGLPVVVPQLSHLNRH